MENKREVSILIPYKVKDEVIFVYLQKRSKDSRILPNHFSFFGGKLEEGENPKEALEREIQEEMCFIPKDYEFLGKYNFTNYLANIYFLKVDDNFDQTIKIMEGDYGRFFSESEIIKEKMIIDSDKDIIKDLYRLLLKKK